MKQSLVFIHPTRFKRSEVQVGPDLWMFVVGISAAIGRLGFHDSDLSRPRRHDARSEWPRAGRAGEPGLARHLAPRLGEDG